MGRLEDLKEGAVVTGVLPGSAVTVKAARWCGSDVVELTYADGQGKLGSDLIYRDREAELTVLQAGSAWSFSADGASFRLVAEAHRIGLAYLFDPVVAVHTSLIEPLPHQIIAVYEEMLPRLPLRFLLADDPGAGKTIMAGLLMKELRLRGDLHRCLVVCPGNLCEQWQDELGDRFHLPFDVLSRQTIEESRSGNPFVERDLLICRLDHLSRNEDVQAKLRQSEWDLIVCDEAHKMSASLWGGEIRYTKRYRLGQTLSGLTRHFLLMTATPHSGKEEDFQLFMALLDRDRFEGRFTHGVHTVDTSDLMRRLVKEKLLRFDGTPLFPERRAYTVSYRLSDQEAVLYSEVTDYVREEFNRADALGQDGRKGTVGFALTILQRRLASSPEAILQSLQRRRDRLNSRLKEEQSSRQGPEAQLRIPPEALLLDDSDIDDLEDAPEAEAEEIQEAILDQATAARTISELEAEILTLERLCTTALRVRDSGRDKKWDELSRLLKDNAEMFDAEGHRRKLIIFTEYRDTLNYLTRKIRTLLGREEAVVDIHGGLGREERRSRQEAFTQNKEVLVLVATDAAGEGINLQRAHLLVNYDLPWNPNRLEQRFGRIHRIGQTEVCHMWNLVAEETREGDVYLRLLEKLEAEREALGGCVFDVLGKAFQGDALRKLLIEAIRYGDSPEVKARLTQQVTDALDKPRLIKLLEERALVDDAMDLSRVLKVREEMERAEARRLQPHFVASFFREALERLGGTMREREPGRYEITHVPSAIRNHDRQLRRGAPVQRSYERVTFDKHLTALQSKPMAEFLSPGHPLIDATTDLVLERHRDLLRQGAILVDPTDESDVPRVLILIESAIRDGSLDRSGNFRIISRRMQFVEISETGETRDAGPAPYLDYQPLEESEVELIRPILTADWLRDSVERRALDHAIQSLIPGHLTEVGDRREKLVLKTMAAVKDRLTKAIAYWDQRAQELRRQEEAGKTPRINSEKAREYASELEGRLRRRMEELERECKTRALPPVVVGGALIVPMGLLRKLKGETTSEASRAAAEAKRRVEAIAMQAVLEYERAMGYEPRDVSRENLGYDIESRVPATGQLRFIEVKGRDASSDDVTISRNEILTGLNKPEAYFLAIVRVADDGCADPPVYIQRPFERQPDYGQISATYKISELMRRAATPP